MIGIVELQEKIVAPISNSHTLCKMADIQYVGHAILETARFSRNSVLRSFWRRWSWIWHRIFGIQNCRPNMMDIIFWKPNDFRGTLYFRAFGVADYEFDIGLLFFGMADPISRTWNFGNSTILPQLCTREFSGSLITNIKLDFQKSAEFKLILMRYFVPGLPPRWSAEHWVPQQSRMLCISCRTVSNSPVLIHRL